MTRHPRLLQQNLPKADILRCSKERPSHDLVQTICSELAATTSVEANSQKRLTAAQLRAVGPLGVVGRDAPPASAYSLEADASEKPVVRLPAPRWLPAGRNSLQRRCGALPR